MNDWMKKYNEMHFVMNKKSLISLLFLYILYHIRLFLGRCISFFSFFFLFFSGLFIALFAVSRMSQFPSHINYSVFVFTVSLNKHNIFGEKICVFFFFFLLLSFTQQIFWNCSILNTVFYLRRPSFTLH